MDAKLELRAMKGKSGLIFFLSLFFLAFAVLAMGCGRRSGKPAGEAGSPESEAGWGGEEPPGNEAGGEEEGLAELKDFGYGETNGGTEEVMVLEGIRFGDHLAYERVIIQFAPQAYNPHYGIPRYRVRYLTPPYADVEGNPVPLEGEYLLEITFNGNKADLSPPEGYVQVYTGPDEFAPGYSVIKEAKLVPAYELNTMIMVVGLGSHAPYKVQELSNPPRIVVDVYKSE